MDGHKHMESLDCGRLVSIEGGRRGNMPGLAPLCLFALRSAYRPRYML